MKRVILHFLLMSTLGLTNPGNHDQIIISSEKNSFSIDHSIPPTQISPPSSNVHSGVRTSSNSFAQQCQQRYEQELNKKILEQQLLYHCQQNGIDFAWARYQARGVAEHCIHINFLNGPEWSPQRRKPSELPFDFVDEFGCWSWIKPWEISYQLSKLTFEVARIGIAYAIDKKMGKKILSEYLAPIKQLSDAIEQEQISVRDVVKGTAQLVTQVFAQEKMLNSLHGLCKYANRRLTNYVSNNPLAHSEHFLMTADGQLVQAINELPHAHFMEGQPAGAKPKKIKHPPIPTEGPLWHFSPGEIESGVKVVMDIENNFEHVFGQEKHNLEPFKNTLGGYYEVMYEVLNNLSGKVSFNGLFRDIKLQIAGYEVYVRGRMINGIPNISTMYIK